MQCKSPEYRGCRVSDIQILTMAGIRNDPYRSTSGARSGKRPLIAVEILKPSFTTEVLKESLSCKTLSEQSVQLTMKGKTSKSRHPKGPFLFAFAVLSSSLSLCMIVTSFRTWNVVVLRTSDAVSLAADTIPTASCVRRSFDFSGLGRELLKRLWNIVLRRFSPTFSESSSGPES